MIRKKIQSKKSLNRCPICDADAGIMDYVRDDGRIDGIGEVGCMNSKCKAKHFRYSGKLLTTKNEAIGMWNLYCSMWNL